MGRKESRWLDRDNWSCPNHIPSLKLPAHADKCWYVNCQSRPPEALRPEPPIVVGKAVGLCAWEKCAKGLEGGRADARNKSKYCSRDCSNKNARFRHKARKEKAA